MYVRYTTLPLNEVLLEQFHCIVCYSASKRIKRTKNVQAILNSSIYKNWEYRDIRYQTSGWPSTTPSSFYTPCLLWVGVSLTIRLLYMQSLYLLKKYQVHNILHLLLTRQHGENLKPCLHRPFELRIRFETVFVTVSILSPRSHYPVQKLRALAGEAHSAIACRRAINRISQSINQPCTNQCRRRKYTLRWKTATYLRHWSSKWNKTKLISNR